MIIDKFQIISRQFLRASQLYKVYQFAVHRLNQNNKFKTYFASENIVGHGTKELELTLFEINRLNQLLNVQYLHIFNYNHNHTNEYSALCKIFKGLLKIDIRQFSTLVLGHISLSFCNGYNTNVYCPSNIITQLQKQLYKIIYDARFLIDSTKMPCLNLLVCRLLRLNNFCKTF